MKMPLIRLLVLTVALALGVGEAFAQVRSIVQLDQATSRSLIVAQLQSGTVSPIPIAPTPLPTVAQPVPPSQPGSPQEATLLMPVLFGFDSAVLTGQARTILATVAEAMKDPVLRGSRFLLEGHADASGRWDYNQRLSERRADAVARYLMLQGVEADRLMILGYSWNRLLPGMPLTDARHRRVEIGRLP